MNVSILHIDGDTRRAMKATNAYILKELNKLSLCLLATVDLRLLYFRSHGINFSSSTRPIQQLFLGHFWVVHGKIFLLLIVV